MIKLTKIPLYRFLNSSPTTNITEVFITLASAVSNLSKQVHLMLVLDVMSQNAGNVLEPLHINKIVKSHTSEHIN